MKPIVIPPLSLKSLLILPLTPIEQSRTYDHARLATIDTFDAEDQAYYDRAGWDKYRKEYHRRTLLPELGPARCFSGRALPVVPIAGRRFRVSVMCGPASDEPYLADGKSLVLAETDDPETRPDCNGDRCYCQFFGQPRWVQGEHFPADPRGECCRHLLTVENGWGDCGNWNILVGLDPAGLPDVAYFEASCC